MSIATENRNLKNVLTEVFPDMTEIKLRQKGVVLVGDSSYYITYRKKGFHMTVSRNYNETTDIVKNVKNDDVDIFMHKATGFLAVRNARLSTLLRIVKESEIALH